MSVQPSPFALHPAPPPNFSLAGALPRALKEGGISQPQHAFTPDEVSAISALIDSTARLAGEVEKFRAERLSTAHRLSALGMRPEFNADIAGLRAALAWLPLEQTEAQRARIAAMAADHQRLAERALANVALLRTALGAAIASLDGTLRCPIPPGKTLIERAFDAHKLALEDALPIAPSRPEDASVEVNGDGRVQPLITLRLREPFGDDLLVAGLRRALRRVETESPEVARIFAFRVIDDATGREFRIPTDLEEQAMLAFQAGRERYAETYDILGR